MYKEAIKRYFKTNCSDEEIARALLASFPDAMVAVLDELEGADEVAKVTNLFSQDLDQIKHYVIVGQMVNAIKLHRANTGQGLKESKNDVDRLRLSLYNAGVCVMSGSGTWKPVS
jgi:hypothetical protein